MNIPLSSPVPDSQAGKPSAKRLKGHWLTIARVAWLAFFTLAVLVLLLAIPSRWQELKNPSSAFLASLDALGWSLGGFAVFSLITELLFIGVYLFVGLFIFMRRSDDAMALFTSLMLVAFGVGNQTITPTIGALGAGVFAIFGYVAWVTFTQFPYLFPSGQYVPRWTRIPAVIWFLLVIPWNFMVGTALDPTTWPPVLFLPLFVFLWATFVISQVYRYTRVSNAVQRQQTKWVMFAFVMTVAILVLISVVLFQFESTSTFSLYSTEAETPQTLLLKTLTFSFFRLAFLLLPIAFAISILRYRLWDIDIIIRRTLVYVPLTAILAGIFAASISLTQRFFVSLTGQQSDAATVLTTLIVVAAFEPVKSWLQKIVERRFKEVPNPTKSLNAFSGQVKSEMGVIDPRRITRRLLDEAMTAFEPKGGAVFLANGHGAGPLLTRGEWDGMAALSVPLDAHGKLVGELQLGARKNGGDYGENEQRALQDAASVVADAIADGNLLPRKPSDSV